MKDTDKPLTMKERMAKLREMRGKSKGKKSARRSGVRRELKETRKELTATRKLVERQGKLLAKMAGVKKKKPVKKAIATKAKRKSVTRRRR